MTLKLYYTPVNLNNITRDIFKDIINNSEGIDFSHILYIAPSTAKIEEAKKIFHSLVDSRAYIPPQMSTLSQFAKRLCETYSDKKIISNTCSKAIISTIQGKGIGSGLILSNFIDTIKTNFDYYNNNIKEIFESAFNKLGISDDIKERIDEAILLFEEYQKILSQYNLIDIYDALSISCTFFNNKRKINTSIFDGFYELKHNEKELFKKIVTNSENSIIIIPYSNIYHDILNDYIQYLKNNFEFEEQFIERNILNEDCIVYSFRDVEEEVEGIAKNIKYYFMCNTSIDLNNIIITLPNYYKYYDTIHRIFDKFGIPFVFKNPKPLGKIKPYTDLINFLESIIEDYPRLTFSSFLMSEYFKKLPDVFKKYIPFISLYTPLKGKYDWLNLIKLPGLEEFLFENIRCKDNKILEDISSKLRWLFKIIEPLEEIKDCSSFSNFSEKLIHIINTLDFYDPFNKKTDAKQKIYEILNDISLLDIFKEYSKNFSRITLRDFTDILKISLNSSYFEPETTGVQIISIFDCQYLSPDYIYFAGLIEGDFPIKPEIDYLLPENIKSYLKLPDINKSLKIQKFIFDRITKSSKNVIISYPTTEDDKILLPSPFVPWKTDTKLQIRGIFSKEEELIYKGKEPFSNYLKEISISGSNIVKKMFSPDKYIKVTDIDNYRFCPRRFFLEKVLNLIPLDLIEYRIEKLLLGRLSHKIMELILSKPFSSKEELKNIFLEKSKVILNNEDINEYWKSVITNAFLKIIDQIYEIEEAIKKDGYIFAMGEKKVKGELVQGIKLVGEIDRIDVKSNFEGEVHNKNNRTLSIIDYKTGSYDLSGIQTIKSGKNLQLFLYAALLKQYGYDIERVGIYSLKDLKLTWLPNKRNIKDNVTIEDYINSSIDFLKETVMNMRNGVFYAKPLNENSCKFCSESPYCPHIQKIIYYNEQVS